MTSKKAFTLWIVFCFSLVMAVAAGVATAQAPSSVTIQPTRTVAEFIDLIGVNTHFTYPDTPYLGQFEVAKQKLVDVGIKHIRDGVAKESYKHEPMNAVCDAGVKLQTGIDRRVSGWSGKVDFAGIDYQIGVIKDYYLNCVEGIEGVNEYDLNHGYGSNPDSDWKNTLRSYTETLYNKIKSDPVLASLPVVAPSVSWYNAEGIGDMSAWFDYGNSHPYPGGNVPTTGLAENLERGKVINGSKPIFATETGYHTAVTNDGEVRAGWGQRSVSETAQAKYIPRLLAEYFNAGIVRTYLYEFIDSFNDPERDNQESNFGLLRHDLTEKPAYLALRSLLTILKPGTAAPIASNKIIKVQDANIPVSFELKGNDLNDVHFLALKGQEALGVSEYFLLLWREVPSYDYDTKKDLTVATRLVSVSFPTVSRAELYNLDSEKPYQVFDSTTSVEINVPDDVTTVRIVQN